MGSEEDRDILNNNEIKQLKVLGRNIYTSLECDINSSGIPCLTDRLYAPTNIRFSEKQMYNQLLKVGFNNVKVHQTRDGLFCQVIK